jgi:hypothetical protein
MRFNRDETPEEASMKENWTSEEAAHLARITIVVPPVKDSWTPEEVAEILARQREFIALRFEVKAGRT